MNTEKPGQQSNPQDPSQRDRDNEKSGQQRSGQNDPQKDRKPGQGQQGDIERDKKSA